MPKHVLILGGGFGGIAAAVRLRRIAPDVDVTLADHGTHFKMGFRKTMELTGRGTVAEGSRPLSALSRHGIRVLHGEVTMLDPVARSAVVGGTMIDADAIVVALGAHGDPGATPGFSEHGLDVYGAGLSDATAALGSMTAGKVVIGVLGNPYPCSPAPFEMALLIEEGARERKARIDLTVFSPLPSSLPVVGPAGCEAIEGRLAGRLIDFRPHVHVESVEAGRVLVKDGDAIPFDLLLGIPGHVVPQVLVDAGLAPPGGWVKVTRSTLQTAADGVWAVGDCVGMMIGDGSKPLPKAGALAESAGIVAADRIAAFLSGEDSNAVFLGDGGCYIESGDGEAMMVRGQFLADPPQVELTPPSREHRESKERYERDRLADWFGE